MRPAEGVPFITHSRNEKMKRSFIFLILFGMLVPTLRAGKTTVMVPMRDGVLLATDIYAPDDTLPHPVLLYRTPYNKDRDKFDKNLLNFWVGKGYVFVDQDTRGRFASQGVDSTFLTDGWGPLQDGYDTIDWIVKQPWSNGKVGMLGASAIGITTYWGVASLHPAVKCAIAIVAPSDFYHEVVFPGGEFRKSLVENWIHSQGSNYMIDFFGSHRFYDALWDFMNLHTRSHLITTPILHIGGWYDCFSEGTVAEFNDLSKQPQAGPQYLVMGPWIHQTTTTADPVGELTYPAAAYSNLFFLFNWLDFWLQGRENGVLATPKVQYYLMGDPDRPDEAGCSWITKDKWPDPDARPLSLFLKADGELAKQVDANEDSLGYDFDPRHPVPTLGGNNLTIPAGPRDQRTVTDRSDVLLFETAPLPNPLWVEGYVTAKLYIESNRKDTDFTLKLIDVYPDGRQMLVTDGIIRARFRHGDRKEEMAFLVPGQMDSVEIKLPPTAIVFNSGHRLMVAVSSSNYPRFDVNTNTGGPLWNDPDTLVAHNTLFMGNRTPSRVLLPVVPLSTSVVTRTTGPLAFALFQNYPNPFNSATEIQFQVPRRAHVHLAIYDVHGRLVQTLVNGERQAGHYRVQWQAGRFPSGVYFYRMRIGNRVLTRKLLLLE